MYNFFISILIGIGVVLPGVSGSAIAILVGIYDKILYVLNDNNILFLKKFVILLPIVCGILIGAMLFGNILLRFYENYEFQMKYIFIGLIFGGIPILYNELKNRGGNIKKIPFILSILFSLILITIPITMSNSKVDSSPLKLFIAGIFYISGKIIPGISSSFFLMLLGLYEKILSILSNPFSISYLEWISFIPFMIGIIIGAVILIKIITYLFNTHISLIYSIIIGFISGSTLSIFPGFKFNFKCIFSILLMVLSFLLTNKLSKNNKKNV